MLSTISEEHELSEAQRHFEERLDSIIDRKGLVAISYKGGSEIREASWSNELQFWRSTHKVENRYCNVFGTREPSWNKKTSISATCEINIPFKGVNRRVAGVFARDETGNIYLLHRGKIGGGKKHIGKSLFWESFRGESEPVMEKGLISNLALIGPLANSKSIANVANFVREVERIKMEVSDHKSSNLVLKDDKR